MSSAPPFATYGAAISFADRKLGCSYQLGMIPRVISEWENHGHLGRCPFRNPLSRKEWSAIGSSSGCGYSFAEDSIKDWLYPIPKWDARGRPPIAEEVSMFLDEVTYDFAELSLDDYVDLCYFELGEVVSESWVSGALKKLGLRLRKPSVRHIGRYTNANLLWSVEYASLCREVDPVRFRFLDGAGFTQKNTGAARVRTHSSFASVLAVGGRRTTNYTAMGLTSIVDEYAPVTYEIFDGLMGEIDYVGWVLRMYDRDEIRPNNILVRDNWSGQTGAMAAEMERVLAGDNITFLPLPTFTPEWNPIEYCWNCAKYRMRRMGSRGTDEDVIARAARSLDSITYDNMLSWYNFCGYI